MANNVSNLLGPQPDFLIISQCHETLAGEMRKVPNTPQYHTGDAILAELRQINARLDRAEQASVRLEGAVQQINTRLETVTTAVQVSDHNNYARVSNSLLLNASDVLIPLRNPRDNTPIPGFPATPGDIANMSATSLNSVLRELGLGSEGQKAVKELRLRQYIGLKRSPA